MDPPGAPNPRVDSAYGASPAPLTGMSIKDGRKWWAFQSLKEMPVPRVKNTAWAKNKIDSFILAELEHAN